MLWVHMFWLRDKKNNFQLHTLIWGPVSGSKIFVKQGSLGQGKMKILRSGKIQGILNAIREIWNFGKSQGILNQKLSYF